MHVPISNDRVPLTGLHIHAGNHITPGSASYGINQYSEIFSRIYIQVVHIDIAGDLPVVDLQYYAKT